MGMMGLYACDKCGFGAKMGCSQPYYLFCGPVIEKYCPKTKEIVSISAGVYGSVKIACQSENWADIADDVTPCQNCNAECLQDFKIVSVRNNEIEVYRCPSCGGLLKRDPGVLIMAD